MKKRFVSEVGKTAEQNPIFWRCERSSCGLRLSKKNPLKCFYFQINAMKLIRFPLNCRKIRNFLLMKEKIKKWGKNRSRDNYRH